jgi:hypothetical protein
MGSMTRLWFVLSERMPAHEFERVCELAGFSGARARGLRALYAGPTSGERRLAAALGARLWLPTVTEPLLAGTALDDLPGAGGSSNLGSAGQAGAAALEIARRHLGSQVAVVVRRAWFDPVMEDLEASIPHRMLLRPTEHAALFELGLRSLESLAHSVVPVGQGSRCGPESGETDQRVLAFLAAHDAGAIEHPGGTLLAHLCGTASLLRCWQARPALVTAGLAHAIYGTDGFPTALLGVDARTAVAELAGPEAEAIVYAYASCDRSAGHPSAQRPSLRDRFTGQRVPLGGPLLHDLTTLTCANDIDIFLHTRTRHEFASLAPELLRRCSALGNAAETCVDRTLDVLLASPSPLTHGRHGLEAADVRHGR